MPLDGEMSMLKDRLARVKLKKHYHEQRPRSYVGRVTGFSNYWVVMEGRGIMLARAQSNGVQVDAKATHVVIPRDNIDHIQVLPDAFDMKNIQFTTEGQQVVMLVPNAQSCFLGEIGEG